MFFFLTWHYTASWDVVNEGMFWIMIKYIIIWYLIPLYVCCRTACDPSCDGCSGDGPDMCDRCVSGYGLKDGICMGKSWF